MNDIHLYIDASPNSVMTLEVEKALKGILTLFQGSMLRITWLYRGRRLSFVTMLRFILAERRLCKGRSIAINNTIRFENVKTVTPSAVKLLRDFNFSVVLPENASNKICSRLQKKQIDISNTPCVDDDLETFREWLEDNPMYKNEVYSSYIRMALGLAPYSCKYRSCLGKTIYIDPLGKLHSCPFKVNRVELGNIEDCYELQDVFSTDDYEQLIQHAISRRENCRNACGVFGFCLGGCPLEAGDCPENNLTNAIDKAKAYMQENGTEAMAIHGEFCSLLSQQFRV